MARELVNRIQNIRKNRDFAVTDRITIQLEDHAEVRPAVTEFGDYIRTEVLADELTLAGQVEGEQLELPEDVKVQVVVELV
jgi:isoleucyl-tRNA synthetase